MQADITDNTLPGAEPQKITAPFVVWIAGFFAGPVLGAIWMYRNARHLGCRDAKHQGIVLATAAAFCAPSLIFADYIRDNFEKGGLERLGTALLVDLVLIVAVGASGYCYMRQRQLFSLHSKELGSARLRLPLALAFLTGSWVLTFLLLAAIPRIGEAMGGLAYYLN